MRVPRAVAIAGAAVLSVAGCRSMAAYDALLDPVAILDGRLDPCPQSPNCVSSQAWDPDQYVEPLPYPGEAEDALDQLEAIIEAWPRARVTHRVPGYLHAEFESRLLGFTDDVDLLADPESGVIHVRSASRRGYHDWGVNRERVEALREAFGGSMLPLR